MTDVVVRRPAPGIVELVIDGPPLNILSSGTQSRLASVLKGLHQQDDVDAVFITGAGDRAFSVGADIREAENGARGDPWGGMPLAEHCTSLLAALPSLTVAVIHGHCLGGGLELALCTDLRIAAPDASFGVPEVRIGLIPGMGATVRLPELVGRPWATRMLLTGVPVDAYTAAQIGLVQAVTSEPRTLALQWAAQLQIAAPLARRAIKSLLSDGSDYVSERRAWRTVAGTHDAVEGRSAFLEHRAARFTGC